MTSEPTPFRGFVPEMLPRLEPDEARFKVPRRFLRLQNCGHSVARTSEYSTMQK